MNILESAPGLKIADFGWTVPAWLCPDIYLSDLATIAHGGCESGAYMPAVTYCDAMATMAESGDEVFAYLEDHISDGLVKLKPDDSWAGFCCRVLSTAVEVWAARELEAWQDRYDGEPQDLAEDYQGGAWYQAAFDAGLPVEIDSYDCYEALAAALLRGDAPQEAALALRLAHPDVLLDDMVRDLRVEADAAGDDAMVMVCDIALGLSEPTPGRKGFSSIDDARTACASAISRARAMDGNQLPPVVA